MSAQQPLSASRTPTRRKSVRSIKLPYPPLPDTSSPDFWRVVFIQSLAEIAAAERLQRSSQWRGGPALDSVIYHGRARALESRAQAFGYWMKDAGGLVTSGGGLQ